jgi:hypothetical protein
VVAGDLTPVWALVVWQWMDPFTALYAKWKQHEIAEPKGGAPYELSAAAAQSGESRR